MSAVAKPRLSYAAFQAAQQGITLAALVEKYIVEMSTVKPLGESHRLTPQRR